MQAAYLTVIDDLKSQIALKESELLPLKRMVNGLCLQAGIPLIYNIDDLETEGTAPSLRFRVDEFFNKPLAPSVATYLEARDAAKLERPASIDEIYEALVSGGYKFEGATGSEDNSKRALKIALTKNTAQFVKIGERYALKKWYNMRASRKAQNGGEPTTNTTSSETAGDSPETSPEGDLINELDPSSSETKKDLNLDI